MLNWESLISIVWKVFVFLMDRRTEERNQDGKEKRRSVKKRIS